MMRFLSVFCFAAACALLAGCSGAEDPSASATTTNAPPDGMGWVGARSNVVAGGSFATAEGDSTVSQGHASHAEGSQTSALGDGSHAEGVFSVATGKHAHAEGQSTEAPGLNSHAENYRTVAGAKMSHAGGIWTDVLPQHTNAFIHAAGRTNEHKQTQFANTAHFDRLHVFESANDDPHSVLPRWQSDIRYGKMGGGDLAKGVGNKTLTNTAFVGGGYFNIAGGFGTYIGGGMENFSDGDVATISGGWANRAPGWGATIGGGGTNFAAGSFATVPGGEFNAASGDFSFAAGRDARAQHNGTFVWADHQNGSFRSTAPDQFLVRAKNGVGINTEKPAASLDVNGDGFFARGIRFPPQGDISMGIFTNKAK